MDPNEALKELRGMVADVSADQRTGAIQRFAEQFEALDEWLSWGGFLPAAWHQASAARGEQVYP